jgi:protein-L-isoaspartate(D-aspartate) O-methyltransferase
MAQPVVVVVVLTHWLDPTADNESHSYEIIDVPGKVAVGVRMLLRRLGLRYGALDFAVTDSGQWLFYEINPNGQWGLQHRLRLMDAELAARLRAGLVAALRADGAVTSARWAGAFASVPRHEFLPVFFAPTADRAGWRLVGEPDGEEWSRLVYADEAWVTQLDAGPRAAAQARSAERLTGEPTSSSSAPSLMGRMLEALDVADGSRVLELGTGTGYNTALLCAGLSDRQVTSADIDPHLVEAARGGLARAGYHPLLWAADGDTLASSGHRYDRLIVTYAVPRIPAAWLTLADRGAVIVAPLYRELAAGAMIRLAVTSDGQARGRFLPFYGGFMPTRRRAGPNLTAAMQAAGAGQGTSTTTRLPELTLGQQPQPWHDYAALVLGDIHIADVFRESDGHGQAQHWLVAPDGSWACQQAPPEQTASVTQGGPRRLWTELEAAHARWHDLGRPPRERLGLTVTASAQHLWIDDPGQVVGAL